MFTFFFVGLKVVAVIVFFFYFSSYLINRILLVSCGESFITLVCRDFRSSPKEQSFSKVSEENLEQILQNLVTLKTRRTTFTTTRL